MNGWERSHPATRAKALNLIPDRIRGFKNPRPRTEVRGYTHPLSRATVIDSEIEQAPSTQERTTHSASTIAAIGTVPEGWLVQTASLRPQGTRRLSSLNRSPRGERSHPATRAKALNLIPDRIRGFENPRPRTEVRGYTLPLSRATAIDSEIEQSGSPWISRATASLPKNARPTRTAHLPRCHPDLVLQPSRTRPYGTCPPSPRNRSPRERVGVAPDFSPGSRVF
jgi:uncharacterized protein YbbK (DUF523 family)